MRVLEFEELVSMLSRVAGTKRREIGQIYCEELVCVAGHGAQKLE